MLILLQLTFFGIKQRFRSCQYADGPYYHIVDPDDRNAFIHLGFDDTASYVMEQMQHFKTSLDKLNLSVSIGRCSAYTRRLTLQTCVN